MYYIFYSQFYVETIQQEYIGSNYFYVDNIYQIQTQVIDWIYLLIDYDWCAWLLSDFSKYIATLEW